MTDQLQAHLDLLAIQRVAARRDSRLAGALLVLTITAIVVWGLLHADQPSAMTFYVVGPLAVAFLISYVRAYVQLETAKTAMALIEAWQRNTEAAARYDSA